MVQSGLSDQERYLLYGETGVAPSRNSTSSSAAAAAASASTSASSAANSRKSGKPAKPKIQPMLLGRRAHGELGDADAGGGDGPTNGPPNSGTHSSDPSIERVAERLKLARSGSGSGSENNSGSGSGSESIFFSEWSPILRSMIVLLAVDIWLLGRQSQLVPEPYMDEEFHVAQAQAYCNRKYLSWNRKITTFPGLYMVSVIISRTLAYMMGELFSSSHPFCSVYSLRFINIVFHVGSLGVLFRISKLLFPVDQIRTHAVRASMISLLPLTHFYTLLYYTESGSIFFILLAYAMALENRFFISAVVSSIAILFRQSNLIWIVFIIGSVVIRAFHEHIIRTGQGRLLPEWSVFRVALNAIEFAIRHVRLFLMRLWTFTGLMIICAIGFTFLFIRRGSIVLGDDEHHSFSIHLAQLVYLALGLFGVTIVDQLSRSHTETLRFYLSYVGLSNPPKNSTSSTSTSTNFAAFRLTLIFVGLVLFSWLTYQTRIIHPFLLADNRHVTFYWVKNVLTPFPEALLILAPIAVICGFLAFARLVCRQTRLLCLWLFACSAFSVVVVPLLEVRYFLVPIVLYLVHVGESAPSRLYFQSFVFILGSVVQWSVWWLLTFRDVHGDLQRFMW